MPVNEHGFIIEPTKDLPHSLAFGSRKWFYLPILTHRDHAMARQTSGFVLPGTPAQRDLVLRLCIFACALAPFLLPTIDINLAGQRSTGRIGGPVYGVFPALAFLALISPYLDRLRPHGSLLDALTMTCGFLASMLLVLAYLMIAGMVAMGGMLFLPFIWGAMGVAGQINEHDTLEAGEMISVTLGLGGWAIIAAFVLGFIQFAHGNWARQADR